MHIDDSRWSVVDDEGHDLGDGFKTEMSLQLEQLLKYPISQQCHNSSGGDWFGLPNCFKQWSQMLWNNTINENTFRRPTNIRKYSIWIICRDKVCKDFKLEPETSQINPRNVDLTSQCWHKQTNRIYIKQHLNTLSHKGMISNSHQWRWMHPHLLTRARELCPLFITRNIRCVGLCARSQASVYLDRYGLIN